VPLMEVIAGGARRGYEFEQWLPGGDDPDARDVIEEALPEDFDGVLSWGWVDNRPFLRYLHGLMISAWRLGDLERGETLCSALLWPNPGDHLGASDLLAKLIAGESWIHDWRALRLVSWR
jgi:hypothetical protein